MATGAITEENLIKDLLARTQDLLNQEVDVYDEVIDPAEGVPVQKKVGTRRIITAANLQAAATVINSKAVQKYFAEQSRGKNVNVRKALRKEQKLKQVEVQDE